jgi:hypothetical protein
MIYRLRTNVVGGILSALLILSSSPLADIVGPAEPPPDFPPLVLSAQIPIYPAVLLKARFDGEVRVRITTDGDQAEAVTLESGPQIFLQTVKDNIRTWRFEPHRPTTFVAVFRYRLLPDSLCYDEAPTIVLHLPTEVEVTSRGRAICEDLSMSRK